MADTANYLTLSCRTSVEGCKKLSNACHGTNKNAQDCTGRQQHSHICDKMTAKYHTTQVGLQENTTEPEDTTPKQRSHTVKHLRKADAVISGEVRISECFGCLNSIHREKLHDLHANTASQVPQMTNWSTPDSKRVALL